MAGRTQKYHLINLELLETQQPEEIPYLMDVDYFIQSRKDDKLKDKIDL